MNKTYIKRQLTLSELGIPMSEDIQEYYNIFNDLIGDISKLRSFSSLDTRKTFWMKDNKSILELFNHQSENKFYIDVDIWSKYVFRTNINEQSIISDLFSVFIGNKINLEIYNSHVMWWSNQEFIESYE